MMKLLKIVMTLLLIYGLYGLVSVYVYSFYYMHVQKNNVLNNRTTLLSDFNQADETMTEKAALHSGVEGSLQLRLDLIRKAKETLLVSQYSIGVDKSGLLFINELKEAADRGVEIKLLVNRFSNKVNHNSYLSVLDSYENVEIKVVGGVNLLKPWEMNNVLHDKLIIVDNDYLLSSGRNINDRFQIVESEENLVDDLDIIIENTEQERHPKLIEEGKNYYELLWNTDYAKPKKKYLNSKWIRHTEEFENQVRQTRESFGKTLGSKELEKLNFHSIDNGTLVHNTTNQIVKEPVVWAQMTQFMNEGTGEFNLLSPYVVLTNNMLDFIEKKPDMVLNIYTNSKANSPNILAYSGFFFQKNKVLKTATVWELQTEESNHQKGFLMSENILGIGSMNSDSRSAYFSSENLVIIKSEGLAKELGEVITTFESQSLKAESRTKYALSSSTEPLAVSPIKNVLINVLSLFSPLFRFLL